MHKCSNNISNKSLIRDVPLHKLFTSYRKHCLTKDNEKTSSRQKDLGSVILSYRCV